MIALYVAVFPAKHQHANINMVVHPELGGDVPLWALWVRLPLQLVLIAWAFWVSRSSSPTDACVKSAPSQRLSVAGAHGMPTL